MIAYSAIAENRKDISSFAFGQLISVDTANELEAAFAMIAKLFWARITQNPLNASLIKECLQEQNAALRRFAHRIHSKHSLHFMGRLVIRG